MSIFIRTALAGAIILSVGICYYEFIHRQHFDVFTNDDGLPVIDE